MILKQRQGGKRKEFELLNNTDLKIKEKQSGELKEWIVKLDMIGHNLIYQEATRKRLYILSSFFTGFLVFITIALSIDFKK